MDNGVAIPHLFVNGLNRTIFAFGKIPDGVDFDAIVYKPKLWFAYNKTKIGDMNEYPVFMFEKITERKEIIFYGKSRNS